MCHRSISLAIIGATMLFILGCSGGGQSPVVPAEEPAQMATAVEGQSTRILWGIWDIHLDPSELTATIEPLRNPEIHFNITGYVTPPVCKDCLIIKVNSFDPVTRILDADVTLRNPTQFIAHDVRGILYTNEAGHRLMNADDWTGLWDIPGGMDINPFKAYGESEDVYRFKPGESFTRNYQIYIPIPPHYEAVKYAVDGSWPDNCNEPHTISHFWTDKITEDVGSSGYAYVYVGDHGLDENEVTLSVPDITGEDITIFTDEYHHIWSVKISNNMGAPAGDYEVLLTAKSEDSGDLALYDFATLTISESGPPPLEPVDVTPPWLHLTPYMACTLGDYLLVSGIYNHLNIFSNSDPTNPVWVNRLVIGDYASTITADENFAYALADGSLHIISIDNSGLAQIVNSIDIPGSAAGVALDGDYAYVTGYELGLHILDINPPESAHIIKTVETPTPAKQVEVEGGYAYVLSGKTYNTDLHIIDIDPLEDAHIVNTLGPNYIEDFESLGDYLFIAAYDELLVYDVNPPEAAHIVASLDDFYALISVDAYGPWLYAVDLQGLHIIDIDPIVSINIYNTVEFRSYGEVYVSHTYAYIAAGDSLWVIDVEPPEAAYIAKTIYSIPGSIEAIDVDGGYTCANNRYAGLYIIDSSTPELSYIVNKVLTETDYDFYLDLAICEGYAYITGDSNTYGILEIVDIEPPESAHTVNTYYHWNGFTCIDVDEEYAYIGRGGYYLDVFDINPPEDTYLVNTGFTEKSPTSIVFRDGYAYITSYEGFHILKIEMPDSIEIVKSIFQPGSCRGVAVEGDFAYFGSWDSGLQIVDINPPESAHIINTVETQTLPKAIDTEGGYAFLACDIAGLMIYDVDPPESAEYVQTIDTHGNAVDVKIVEGYAYVAESSQYPWGPGGIQIFKLW